MKTLERTQTGRKSATITLHTEAAKVVRRMAKSEGITADEWLDRTIRENINTVVSDHARKPVLLPADMVERIREFTDTAGMDAGEFVADMIEDAVKQTTKGNASTLAGIPDFILNCWEWPEGRKRTLERKFLAICERMRQNPA